MTREELGKLTDEELNELIATEVMGWHKGPVTVYTNVGEWHTEEGETTYYDYRLDAESFLDNPWRPATSLDCCREMEDRLCELFLMIPYCPVLRRVVVEDDEAEGFGTLIDWGLIHASPRQKCIAALLTLEEGYPGH